MLKTFMRIKPLGATIVYHILGGGGLGFHVWIIYFFLLRDKSNNLFLLLDKSNNFFRAIVLFFSYLVYVNMDKIFSLAIKHFFFPMNIKIIWFFSMKIRIIWFFSPKKAKPRPRIYNRRPLSDLCTSNK